MKRIKNFLLRENLSIYNEPIKEKLVLGIGTSKGIINVSFDYDEAFMLGCLILELVKSRLSERVKTVMKGILGPNFWKVTKKVVEDELKGMDAQVLLIRDLTKQISDFRLQVGALKEERDRAQYELGRLRKNLGSVT